MRKKLLLSANLALVLIGGGVAVVTVHPQLAMARRERLELIIRSNENKGALLMKKFILSSALTLFALSAVPASAYAAGCGGTGCLVPAQPQDPLAPSSTTQNGRVPGDAVQDCTSGGCAKLQPRLQLADPNGGGGNGHHEEPPADPQSRTASAKPSEPSAFSLVVADGRNGSGCKYEEPQDPPASPEDGKRSSSPDAVQDCNGGGCAKLQPRFQLADPGGGGGGGGGGHHEEPADEPQSRTAFATPGAPSVLA
jgi:hypothetical protein